MACALLTFPLGMRGNGQETENAPQGADAGMTGFENAALRVRNCPVYTMERALAAEARQAAAE
jgi:hypothetical protein